MNFKEPEADPIYESWVAKQTLEPQHDYYGFNSDDFRILKKSICSLFQISSRRITKKAIGFFHDSIVNYRLVNSLSNK